MKIFRKIKLCYILWSLLQFIFLKSWYVEENCEKENKKEEILCGGVYVDVLQEAVTGKFIFVLDQIITGKISETVCRID